ncbi:MAG: glycerol-3-phosphate cytidylyltransferase [Pseudonocardiales bacterium]|nr:glycerol-3-phosphate cytidylyltransferase [Pseudonocardiales bacterium]
MTMRIGYTTGVYDMFHVGHLNILRNARAQCDHLIVGVTTDEMSESRKGKRPVVPTAERMQIVESIRFVDQVVAQTSSDKMQAWRDNRFDVMFVGDDWKGTPTWDALEAEFAELGVEIVYFPYTTHTSSTMLRRALDDRLEQAS